MASSCNLGKYNSIQQNKERIWISREPSLVFYRAGFLSVDCHIPEIGVGFLDMSRLNS